MKVLAIVVALLSFAYVDFGSDSILVGYVLPGLLGLSLMFLFWFKGFVAIVVGAAAFQNMNLSSQSTFTGVFLPVVFGICLIYFAWWMLLQLFVSSAIDTSADNDSSVFGGGFDGGDGGGD